MPYPEMLVAPMRAELTNNGFTQLTSADEVENAMQKAKGSTLIMINSVCGCAAAMARPGVLKSISGDKRPDNLYTVFAGQDLDAVEKAREYTLPFPPSSPAIALFKDGVLVHMIERHSIEGRSADMVADNLTAAYEQYC